MSTTVKSEGTEHKPISAMPRRHESEHKTALDSAAAARATWALYIIVVVSGAVLMGIEIAGAKILAPSFGTSTFVWGSIISLFMGALAAGYYLGGMLADKRPAFTVLATIVSMAGLWIWLLPRWGPSACEALALIISGPVTGPLTAALVVFFLPSFLMGMVSPYAVKLQASSLAGLGSVAGKLYAISTAGSIVGALSTTFLLIPYASVSNVMQGLGILMILAAGCCLWMFRKATRTFTSEDRTGLGMLALGALCCAEAWAIFPVEPSMHPGYRLLAYRDSSYHEILVTEDVIQEVEQEKEHNTYRVSQSKDIAHADEWLMTPPRLWVDENSKELPWFVHEVGRWLKFNDNTESGIFPYRPEHKNAVGYTDLLHLPMLWVNDPLPKRILVVGGGGGIVPTQYHNWYGTHVDIAEIDPAVKDVATTFFQVVESPDGITFHIGDGRQTIKRLPPDVKYDVIVLDAYSSGGQIPFHLLTWEFLNEVKQHLTPRGVLATNIISGIRNVHPQTIRPADLFLAEYKTLTASQADFKHISEPTVEQKTPMFRPDQIYVFPRVYEGHSLSGENLEEYRNVIIIAAQEKERRSIDQMAADTKRLTGGSKPLIKVSDLSWHVDHPWLPEQGPKKDELDSVSVLRDDYAPVDTMYRPVKHDEKKRDLY